MSTEDCCSLCKETLENLTVLCFTCHETYHIGCLFTSIIDIELLRKLYCAVTTESVIPVCKSCQSDGIINILRKKIPNAAHSSKVSSRSVMRIKMEENTECETVTKFEPVTSPQDENTAMENENNEPQYHYVSGLEFGRGEVVSHSLPLAPPILPAHKTYVAHSQENQLCEIGDVPLTKPKKGFQNIAEIQKEFKGHPFWHHLFSHFISGKHNDHEISFCNTQDKAMIIQRLRKKIDVLRRRRMWKCHDKNNCEKTTIATEYGAIDVHHLHNGEKLMLDQGDKLDVELRRKNIFAEMRNSVTISHFIRYINSSATDSQRKNYNRTLRNKEKVKLSQRLMTKRYRMSTEGYWVRNPAFDEKVTCDSDTVLLNVHTT